MNTLIIYDAEGYIIQQITGSYRVPVGVPYLEIEVPDNKRTLKVDVNSTPNAVIFEDIPPSEVEKLNTKVAEQEQAILELTMMISSLQGGAV